MADRIARKFIVRGRVQGVGYRYFAISAARQAGVVGTVRNLPDGSVEVVAEGNPDAIMQLKVQLAKGPSLSRVTSVDETRIAPAGRYESFDATY